MVAAALCRRRRVWLHSAARQRLALPWKRPSSAFHPRLDPSLIRNPRNPRLSTSSTRGCDTRRSIRARYTVRLDSVSPYQAYRVLVSDRFRAAEDSEVLRFFEEKLRFVSK
ncbi:MAG: hypothetical protein QOJ05_1678 [Verrucomicrobiota bacterium]